MNRLIPLLIVAALFLPVPAGSSDSGTFRGKWWNYYERALDSMDKSDWKAAQADLVEAVALRDKDQRMARTYGMHFIDYFPHRELGIVYFNLGDMDKANKELEESLKSLETSKASFYLNKIRQQSLIKEPEKPAGPQITVITPAAGSVVKTSTVVVKGKASGPGSVARLWINGQPYRFDRARENVEFSQEVPVEDGKNDIVITAEDLVASRTTSTISFIADRDGPSVQVFDLKPEEEGGKQYVRLIGEVSDATWISRLEMNGVAVDVAGEKSHPLNLRLERGQHKKLTVYAVDPLENETTAEIDVDKDLLALNRPFEPFLIAFNADKLIAFDKTPPAVALKSDSGLPPVFADKFCVDGVVSDNRNIGRIVVNGKEVYTKGGKEVFFSKIVNLREGKNRVVVDVYDTSDNKTTRTFEVTRKIPSVLQNASRMRITVLPFDGGKAAERVQLAYDQLIGAFVDQKRFSVVERAKLEEVLREQKLVKAKLTDQEQSIRIGKLMSADAVLAATVQENDSSLEVVARVISTETSEVLDVKDVYAEDKSAASVRDMMAGLASKVAAGFPVAEGMVVKASGKNIVMDLGDSVNIKPDMPVIIFRRGEEIKHPVTGKSLGWDTVKVAEGRVEDVQANFSKIRLLDKPAPKDVRVKDLIMTK